MSHAYLSTGHGRQTNAGNRYDPGTQGGGASEHVAARRVVIHASRRLKELMVPHTAETCPDGSFHHSPNWHGSSLRVNAENARVAVEVHFDWSGAPRGGFGIHDGSALGRRLADAIRGRYAARSFLLRPHQNRPGLGFLARTNINAAILWECDRIAAYPDSYLKAIGECIAEGVAVYMGFSLRPPPPLPPTGGTMAAPSNPPPLFRLVNGVDRRNVFDHTNAVIRHLRTPEEALERHGPSWRDQVVPLTLVGLHRYGGQDQVWAVVESLGGGWLFAIPNRSTAEAIAGPEWRSAVRTLDKVP